jgi:hypothetical protein
MIVTQHQRYHQYMSAYTQDRYQMVAERSANFYHLAALAAALVATIEMTLRPRNQAFSAPPSSPSSSTDEATRPFQLRSISLVELALPTDCERPGPLSVKEGFYCPQWLAACA